MFGLQLEGDQGTCSTLGVRKWDADASSLKFPSGTIYRGATSDHTGSAKLTGPVRREMKIGMNYNALIGGNKRAGCRENSTMQGKLAKTNGDSEACLNLKLL